MSRRLSEPGLWNGAPVPLTVAETLDRIGLVDARNAWGTVIGRLGGLQLVFKVVEGATGSHGWTDARIATPRGAPALEMHLSAQTKRSEVFVRRGLQVDVEVGDPAFDAAVVVEAAPAATARALLDEPTRRMIVELLPFELDLLPGAVRFRKARALKLGEDVERVVTLLKQVTDRLTSLAMEVNDDAITRMREAGPGTGYRGAGPEQVGAILVTALPSEELDRLHATRARRSRRRRSLLAAAVAIVAAVFYLLSARGR
jgi:hypothetical protein